jgi:hypothetical protein
VDCGEFSYRAGATFSVVTEDETPLTLPTSAWTAVVMARDVRTGDAYAQTGIVVALSALRVNAKDATQTDYAMTMTATSAVTAAWPIPRSRGDDAALSAYLLLTDLSNIDSSLSFTLRSLP